MSSRKILMVKFILIFTIIASWMFLGFPQVFDFKTGDYAVQFPPKVQEAHAAIIDVTIDSSGNFSPASVTITAGDQIRWTNDSSFSEQPASDSHTIPFGNGHDIYSTLNVGLISPAGSATTAALTQVGTWGYHNHECGVTCAGTIIIRASAYGCIDCSPPGIRTFSVALISTSSVTIVWTTDEPSLTRLEYGTSTAYGKTARLDGGIFRKEHSITLKNLLPSTFYHYRMYVEDVSGNNDFSKYPNQTVTTLALPIEKEEPSEQKSTPVTPPLIEDSKEQPIDNPEGQIKKPKEGSLIRGPDGIRVYIVNGFGYKRHIFSPAVFNMYGHLSWDNIQTVSQEILDSFKISALFMLQGGFRVYSVEAIDKVSGKAVKRHLAMTSGQFIENGYDWGQVFTINKEEYNYHQTAPTYTGTGQTAVADVAVTAESFIPRVVVIEEGTRIRWLNQRDNLIIEPASMSHPKLWRAEEEFPMHEEYSALDIGEIQLGQTGITRPLTKVGWYGFHDHGEGPFLNGVLIVKTKEASQKNALLDEIQTYTFSQNLREGMRGEEVTKLQTLFSLNPNIYPEGLITGYFGPLTKKALVNFQVNYAILNRGDLDDIKVMGTLEERTRNFINSLFK